MNEDNHLFPGFSIPEGAWLPPELLYILPDIQSVSELKVTIAAIYETLRVGVVEAVVSLSEFEALTGLSRKSVIAGIQRAIERGTVRRQQVGQVYLYRLHFNTHTEPAGRETGPTSGVSPPATSILSPLVTSVKSTLVGEESTQTSVESTQTSVLSPPHVVMHVTSPHSENIQHEHDRSALVAEMRQLGVVLKVAQQMVVKYDPQYLLEKLEQARYAVEAGIADNGPGWFVCSVRDNWQAPLGYKQEGKKPSEETSEDRIKRYTGGKYGHLIEH